MAIAGSPTHTKHPAVEAKTYGHTKQKCHIPNNKRLVCGDKRWVYDNKHPFSGNKRCAPNNKAAVCAVQTAALRWKNAVVLTQKPYGYCTIRFMLSDVILVSDDTLASTLYETMVAGAPSLPGFFWSTENATAYS